jgi:hypothetical protein
MAAAHYGYLILKMSSPNGIIKVRGDRSVDVSALEKLQALAAAYEAAAGHGRPAGRTRHPRVHASAARRISVIQISIDTIQTTRIMENLGDKYELMLVTFLWDNVDVFTWQPSQIPRIPREVIEHHLKIYPDARPVQQRLRS